MFLRLGHKRKKFCEGGRGQDKELGKSEEEKRDIWPELVWIDGGGGFVVQCKCNECNGGCGYKNP